MVNSVHGASRLRREQFYNILKFVKAGKNTDDKKHFNQKTTKTRNFLVVLKDIAKFLCRSLQQFMTHQMNNLHFQHHLRQPGPIKRMEDGGPKLLSQDKMDKRVEL